MSIFLHHLNKILIFPLLFVFILHAQEYSNIGKLSVALKSPGIIFLDSKIISNTSINDLNLKAGTYTLSVKSTNTAEWNQRGFEKEIEILPQQSLKIEIPTTKLIYFNSLPYGSEIIQSNKVLGKTPLYINSSNIDLSKRIIVKKNGYENEEYILNSSNSDYFIYLNPASQHNEIDYAHPDLDNSQTSWFKEGFVVVSILSSWAAFYFKREADNSYNKYLTAGNPNNINKYYDTTKRFDTYSDISIGMSLTALGTYMYFLITD